MPINSFSFCEIVDETYIKKNRGSRVFSTTCSKWVVWFLFKQHAIVKDMKNTKQITAYDLSFELSVTDKTMQNT